MTVLGELEPLLSQETTQAVGVEVIPTEAAKARRRISPLIGSSRVNVFAGDFFRWIDSAPPACFDVVLGNPPFIRYQNFPEPSRSRAMAFMEACGLEPNRLTNSWVPFVVAAVHFLREDGRLAMVLPAELLQVTYAAQLRQYLAASFRRVTIFACNEMFFESAEQEVVLLTAEGKLRKPDSANRCDVKLVEFPTIRELLGSPAQTSRSCDESMAVQHDTEKWLKYFLDAAEISFMRELRKHDAIGTLRLHASIDVGVVTGKNDFFVLSDDEVKQYELRDFVVPLVGRSSQLPGTIHRQVEHHRLEIEGKRVFLLHLSGSHESEFTDGLRAFIAHGERMGAHSGFKCSTRDPWYSVPSVWQPDCFFFRQIYDFPRVVVNKAGATSTDTIHRMRCVKSAQRVASNLYTHLTAASAEIEGRSYGGGVLELEPTEAEKLLMPRHLNGAMPIADADKFVRQGRLAEVLEHNDMAVLRESLGLSNADCKMLKRIWLKMRDRRHSRRKRRESSCSISSSSPFERVSSR